MHTNSVTTKSYSLFKVIITKYMLSQIINLLLLFLLYNK